MNPIAIPLPYPKGYSSGYLGSSSTLAISEVAPASLPPEEARATRLMAPEPAAAAAPEPARRSRGRTAADALPAMKTLLRLGALLDFFWFVFLATSEGEEAQRVRVLLAAAAAAVAATAVVAVVAEAAARNDIIVFIAVCACVLLVLT